MFFKFKFFSYSSGSSWTGRSCSSTDFIIIIFNLRFLNDTSGNYTSCPQFEYDESMFQETIVQV